MNKIYFVINNMFNVEQFKNVFGKLCILQINYFLVYLFIKINKYVKVY